MYYYALLLSTSLVCKDHATLNTWNTTEFVFLVNTKDYLSGESTSLSSASFIVFCDLELWYWPLFLVVLLAYLNLFAAFSQAYLWNTNVCLRQLWSVGRLWQHGHLQKNDTDVTWQGHHMQASLEIKVIRTTLGLFTGWCLAVQNCKLHWMSIPSSSCTLFF